MVLAAVMVVIVSIKMSNRIINDMNSSKKRNKNNSNDSNCNSKTQVQQQQQRQVGSAATLQHYTRLDGPVNTEHNGRATLPFERGNKSRGNIIVLPSSFRAGCFSDVNIMKIVEQGVVERA